MDLLLTRILNGHLHEARIQIHDRLNEIRDKYLVRAEQVMGETFEGDSETVAEANVVRMGRALLIRRRIRKGKVQRNIRRPAQKGFRLKKGKVVRIPAQERMRMKLKARQAARKRKGKMQQILRKRRMSLRKRKSLGIR